MGITEPPQFIVDEFTAVVRVQELDGEGKVMEDGRESFKHKDLGTAGNRGNCRPSGTAVGDREGVTVVSCCLPSVMTHQVHLHLSRSSSRELPGRDDGNESQEASWFCPGSTPSVVRLGLLCPEQAVHRGRPHPEKGDSKKIRDHGSVSCHGTEEFRHGCLESLPTEVSAQVIHRDECFHHGRTIHMLAFSGPGRGSGGHQGHLSQDHALCIGTQ